MYSPTLLAEVASAPGQIAWLIAPPVVLGLAAVYLLLPRPRNYPPLWGAAAGAAALLLAGAILLRGGGVQVETLLFYLFSAAAISAGVMMITQNNPVRAALSFALVILSTCGLFLLQAAPFLMAATIIVYAGAIIVTFLFLIMLAQQAGLSSADARSREPLLASVAGFVLLGVLLYVLSQGYDKRFGEAVFDSAAFDNLLARAQQAAEQENAAEIAGSLGDEAAYFEEFRRYAEAARGAAPAPLLLAELGPIESTWKVWKATGNVQEMRRALGTLVALGTPVRESRNDTGQAALPAANVAYLGRTLFSEFLVAVELGGTLLLVAAIGTIAITAGRAEELR